MVWEGISLAGRTEFVLVNRGTMIVHSYITDILTDHVVPYALVIGNENLIMHDIMQR